MEPLKEMFNLKFYQHFAEVFADSDQRFNPEAFVADVTTNLEALSLNGRLRNTSLVLRQHLPAEFKEAVRVLYKAAPALKHGYTALVLPDFIAMYGKEDFECAMEALKDFTAMGSSEFAIREFLKTDLDRTLKVMNVWAEDQDHHVRRLASEGSRPRLPWSFKLEQLIKTPALTSSILEKLKTDESPYVRKSVANHLNDFSKDNTAYLLRLLGSWDNTHPHTSWIIKHASRTLIKKGNQDSLSLFNFERDVKVRVDHFILNADRINLGEELQFSFELIGLKDTSQKLVVDYAIYYVKSSGEKSRKVFKLKEMVLLPEQIVKVSKRQLFKDLTTRKHYPGTHMVEILVNGKELGRREFDLIF